MQPQVVPERNTALPECKAYCSTFCLGTLPLLGSHKHGQGRLQLQVDLVVAKAIPLGPARYLTNQVCAPMVPCVCTIVGEPHPANLTWPDS